MSEKTDIIAGATEGTLNFGKNIISTKIEKFKNKKLSFVGNPAIIEDVRDSLKTGEWDLYSFYVKDRRLRILIQMGITLKNYEKYNQRKELANLRTTILRKFKKEGLHIAEFVQCGILIKYISALIDGPVTKRDLQRAIEDILNNVEKYCFFIKDSDVPKKKAQQIMTRIDSNLPQSLILFSKKSAILKAKKIEKLIEDEINELGYRIELFTEENKEILCIIKE